MQTRVFLCKKLHHFILFLCLDKIVNPHMFIIIVTFKKDSYYYNLLEIRVKGIIFLYLLSTNMLISQFVLLFSLSITTEIIDAIKICWVFLSSQTVMFGRWNTYFSGSMVFNPSGLIKRIGLSVSTLVFQLNLLPGEANVSSDVKVVITASETNMWDYSFKFLCNTHQKAPW